VTNSHAKTHTDGVDGSKSDSETKLLYTYDSDAKLTLVEQKDDTGAAFATKTTGFDAFAFNTFTTTTCLHHH